MIFSDEDIELIKSDPNRGVINIIAVTRENFSEDNPGWSNSECDALIEAYLLICEARAAELISFDITEIDLTEESGSVAYNINSLLSELKESIELAERNKEIDRLRFQFRSSLGKGFSYEFSQGDLKTLQNLINEIRDHITASSTLEEDHRRRLLKRLENLQSELHKKMSDLDRFWGLIGDAGVVLGKLGTDAKPLVDRIDQMVRIVWRTQSRAEELPSGTELPLLGNKSEQ